MTNKKEIIAQRLAHLREEMAANGWDGVYVTSAENHRYICGFNNPDGQVFVGLENAYVFADFRYIEAARREVPDCLTVIMPEGRRSDYLAKYTAGAAVIAFEDRKLSVYDLGTLEKDLPGVKFVPAGNLFPEIRRIKTPDEIAAIVAAQRIAEGAFEHILSVLNYDMTETEVAAELEYYMKKNGAEDKSFDTIAVSGTNSSSPHGVPRPVKLERGFLTMDYGATVDGYHSDMTRTVVIGKADADERRLYDTVLRAQCAAIDAIRAGEENFAMDKVARDIIEGAGYKGCFGHSLGHGVGLEIHELPTMAPRQTGAHLAPHEIVTVEPGIYIEGKYGCRIEDMLEVTENGSVNLTRAPKELIEI
ncbi:MAG: Xaa-Pro peptidase family protein [Clostridia bacterium]|nr:Xaa-Pro peptidase family protein [Clostridia bacterium]